MTGRAAIDDLLRAFARFLAVAWPEASAMAKAFGRTEDLSDWLQANWEMLVEGGLPPGTFLEVYGEGADLRDRSSRVFFPTARATAAVLVKAVNGMSVCDLLSDNVVAIDERGLLLEEFVTMKGQWFAREPPFDCVLVESAGTSMVFRANEIRFELGLPTGL